MYIITSEQLKSYLTEPLYRRVRICDDHCVVRISVNANNENGDIQVLSKISLESEELFTVIIKLNHTGKVLSYKCEHEDPLKYVGIILYKLSKEDIQSFPYMYDVTSEELQELYTPKVDEIDPRFKESYDLINYYYNIAKRESKIPTYIADNYLKVEVEKEGNELKLGYRLIHDGTPYKIKNANNLLDAIDNNTTMRFSNKLSMVMSEDIFDEDSKEIIYMIRQLNLVHDLQSLDLFYDTLSSLPSKYSNKGYHTLDKKIDLNLEITEDSYIFSIDSFFLVGVLLSNTNLYSFETDYVECYRYNKETITFLNKLKENNYQLVVPKSSKYDFYKYVYKQIEPYINCKTDLWSDFHTENYINLYCDIDDDHRLVCQVEYIYDDSMHYGFEDYPYVSVEADIVENYLRDYADEIKDHMIYFVDNDELVYHFALEGLPYLSNYCHVFASETLKSLGTSYKVGANIHITSNNHLLDINIDTINVERDELYDVLRAYKKHRKYYKLKNGQLLSLESGELKELNDFTQYLNLNKEDFLNDHITLPEYRLFNLEGLSNNSEYIQYQRSEEYKKNLENFNNIQVQPIPDKYQSILRDYQQTGFKWLNTMDQYGFNGILADDMGLGKTIQMLSYLETKKNQGVSIVITPASLMLNWEDELKKFHSSLNVLLIVGDKDTRVAQLESINDYDLVITSYDYLRRDINSYLNTEFECIVLDEAQYIKNPQTKSAECVKQLKGRHRFALTGTPIENSLTEMWSIFDFLMPNYLYTKRMFEDQFLLPIVENNDEVKTNQLKSMISPFVLRRNKSEVLRELPDKIEQDLYYKMSEEEEKYYLSHLVTINKTLQDKMGIKNVGRVEVLSMLTRLREICQDPRIIDDNLFKTPSTKIRNAMELIKTIKENNKKVLLFSSFTSVLTLLEEECKKENISYYRLDGSTTKMNRKKYVDAFQNDDTTLFLISLKAGGTGLNLTSASAVIHFDPWWNMSVKSQATDRTHRIGQKQTVNVYSLYMKNSIEEKIHLLQLKKMNLADTFVEGNKGSVMNITLEDLTSLFEM